VFATGDPDQPPRHLGQCLGWDFDGPGVAAYYPQFIHWHADARATPPADAVPAAARKPD
jgi:hypothetical protein